MLNINIWDNHSQPDINGIISVIYKESARYCRYLFLLQTRNVGMKCINKCTKLINAWAVNSTLHKITLKALSIMPSLLLPKLIKKSKTKEQNEWQEGEIL